ncbi:uncharacterized protein LDX57_002198 [Aspergillus melleus]|uniref:uncharacterized protein n=1 Tax=Aspergillus melleus TaxID=138277 RepID=UPI001E8DC1A6|nr:uncharacterized protein LDX57_002198 [Aspergillus melleus]KAH8424447.1 hypothetical protein LDX57_002198 [Aspergillus melleus]
MTEIAFPISIGPELESYVAKLLDQAGIPNFIWGDPVLDILGTPSLPPYSGWAIPDHCIEAAAKTLDEANFPPCTQGRDCTVFQMISNPYPDYH